MADLVADISDVVEAYPAGSPNRFMWSVAKIGVPDHQPGRITFTAEAPSVGTKLVVLVFGDAGSEIASLSTKKGPRSCENCSDWH